MVATKITPDVGKVNRPPILMRNTHRGLVLLLSAIALLLLVSAHGAEDSSRVAPDSAMKLILDSLISSDSSRPHQPIRPPSHVLQRHRQLIDSVEMVWEDSAVYMIDTLPNGLTAIVRSAGDTTFSAVVVARNDFVAVNFGLEAALSLARIYFSSCAKASPLGTGQSTSDGIAFRLHDSRELQNRLNDCSFCPFTPLVGIEAQDSQASISLDRIAGFVSTAELDSVCLQQARAQFVVDIDSPSGSERDGRIVELLKKITATRPFEPILLPLDRGSAVPGDDELRIFWSWLLDPENLILVVNTSLDTAVIRQYIRTAFSYLPATDHSAYPTSPMRGKKDSTILAVPENPGEWVTVSAGNGLPEMNVSNQVALRVAFEILRSRLTDELVDRKQIARSCGAELEFHSRGGRFYCWASTRQEDRKAALTYMTLQVDKLAYDGPTKTEVEDAARSVWARWLRNRRSSLDRLIHMSYDDYLNRPIPFEPELLKSLKEVNSNGVRTVMARYIRTDQWMVVGVTNEPGE